VSALAASGALDLKATAWVIFDGTTPDAKRRTLFTDPSLRADLQHFLREYVFPRCREGTMKIAVF
jgi:hypothetical protein